MKKWLAVLALAGCGVAVLYLLIWGRDAGPRAETSRKGAREREQEQPEARQRPEPAEEPGATKGKTPPQRPPDTAARKKPEPKHYRLAEATGDPDHAGLRVIVVDRLGQPREGARVGVTLSIDGVGQSGPRLTVDAAGRAEFLDLEEEEVIAVNVTTGPLYRWALLKLRNGHVTEVEMVVGTGVVVEGVVRHLEKGPLPGVLVSLKRNDGAFRDALRDTTDEQGSYRIEGVPAATYDVELTTSRVLYHEQRRGKLEVAEPGPVTHDVVIGHVCMKGVVRDEATGLPLAGAEVQPQQPHFATTKTDASGAYELTSLPPGKYSVLVRKDGYGLRWFKDVEVRADVTRHRDFAIARAAVLHVYFLDDRGRGVPGEHWLDFKSDQGTWSCNVRADRQGHVRYTNVVPGTWTIAAKSGTLKAQPVAAEIGAGENTVRLRFARPEGQPARPTLTGRIVDAASKRPVEGVRVRIHAGRSRDAYTDADGRYAFEDLRPRGHVIRTLKEGYIDKRASARVEKGKESTCDIELQPAATLHLRVTDASGRPITGQVHVAFVEDGVGRAIRLETDEDGRLTCRRLPAGGDRITVSAPGYVIKTVRKEILAGENSLEVQLELR